VVSHDKSTKSGKWVRTPGSEISGSTWGLLGCGATGRATAELLKGFNCKVIGFDPYFKGNSQIEMRNFSEVVENSDILSVHMPATSETIDSINFEVFNKMKKNAILINVGRGELVNESDLIRALKNKVFRAAALDVRKTEPPVIGELEELDNLILTPHIAGITNESQLAINKILVENIDLVLSGKKASHAVGKVS
jgi:D-3-phosphoglycerate dehydrogenase/(S)-sulfolactate dehydrogenase